LVVWDPSTHCPAGHQLKPPNVLIGSDNGKYWILRWVCGLEIQIRHHDGTVTVVQRSLG
jgi:hypothetical protein